MQPAVTSPAPTQLVTVNGCTPNAAATTKPEIGINPTSTPARSDPSSLTALYQQQNPMAVAPTAKIRIAASSLLLGIGHAAVPSTTVATSAPPPAATKQHHVAVVKAPSLLTTPTASNVNDASHPIVNSARANPGPRHQPPADTTAIRTTPTAAPATVTADGRRPASTGPAIANTNGVPPNTAATNPGSPYRCATMIAALNPSIPMAARPMRLQAS